MRVVAMYRVSTEKQASQGASLAAQERIYREIAAKHGWTTVQEFRGCESATQAASDRRVLQQVLACIRETEPDAIYVHEQSRLTRGDELEVALLMRELRERGLKIIVGGVIRDLGSIDERFMVGIQSLVDRAESERIKERFQRGKHQRARQGKKNSGPAPYGYRNPLKGTPGYGTLEVVEQEATAVRLVFDLRAKGTGTRTIAATLNNRGITTRKGAWGKTSIEHILTNPVYIGTQASNVWVKQKGTNGFKLDLDNDRAIVIENAHPAIVDRAVWDAVQNRPRIGCSPAPRMLSRLLHIDGKRYEGDGSHSQRFYRGPKGMKGCPWLDAPTTDDAVWDAFASLATSEEFVQSLMEEAADPNQRMVLLQQVEHLEEQIGKHRRRLNRLVGMRADGEIEKAQFISMSDQTRTLMEAMAAEAAKLKAQAGAMDSSQASRVVRAVQTVLAGRTKLTSEQKRAILRSVVRRIDATAEPTGATLNRDERGRVLPGSSARWRIGRISFTLAVGPKVGPEVPREPGLGTGAPRGNVGETAGARRGQLATTSWDSGQLPGTDPDHRVGQLATTSSCWVLRGPAKP
jgi:DNA invertase Pin-like site-specific DNA recombinase